MRLCYLRRGNGGVEVSEAYHYDRQPGHAGELESRVPGPDPANRYMAEVKHVVVTPA